MKPHATKNIFAGLLLLMAMAMPAGCYPPQYPDYGYYEQYNPGFYGPDVIIDIDRHPRHRERPRVEPQPRNPVERRPELPRMPARPLPAPAPRPMPPSRSMPTR